MSKKLKADAESLRGRLGSPDCPYTSFRLEEGQTVTASFPAKGKQIPIMICFLQPDSYPHSAAIVFCEEEDCLSGKLEEINEYFEKRGTVGEVFAQVCKILDIGELHRWRPMPSLETQGGTPIPYLGLGRLLGPSRLLCLPLLLHCVELL